MALPPQIMAALQGGGPQGPPDQSQGVDPQALMAALQAQGQPGGPPGPSDQSQNGQSNLDLVRQALDLVRQAAANATDDLEAHALEKISTLLAAELAAVQKESDQAMSGKASPRLLRSVYNGQ